MSTSIRNRTIIAAAVVIAVIIASFAFADAAHDEGQAPIKSVATQSTTTTTAPGPTAAEVARWNRAVNINTWNTAVWVNKTNEKIWISKTNARLAAEKAARDAAAAKAAARKVQTRRQAPSPAPAAEQGTGRCGGDLPPCYVMMRESGGNIRAKNPSSSASGKWQFINSTWAGFGGYAEAWMAPESVQDAKARILWANGAGCGHWSAC